MITKCCACPSHEVRLVFVNSLGLFRGLCNKCLLNVDNAIEELESVVKKEEELIEEW